MILLMGCTMKVYLLVWMGCIMPLGIFAQVTVDCNPNLSPDVAVPVTTNTVYLTQPKCCFDGVNNAPCSGGTCEIWLASALNTATNTFDADKNNSNNYVVCPCSPGFDNTSKNYFLIKAGVRNDFPCITTNPNIFKVGGESVCPASTVCTGVLPSGALTRFKYLYVDPVTRKPVAETPWSSTVPLKTVKEPKTIGDGYAGRSAAMVIITTILSVAAGLLLLGLLGALIWACCCRDSKAQNYTTRTPKATKTAKGQPPVIGSLRIPTYDVHHLKNPTPYDNPAYERDFKRYTTSTNLPKASIPQDANFSSTVHSPTNKTVVLPAANYSTTVLPGANYSTTVLPGANYSTTVNSPTNKSTMVLPATNYSTSVLPGTNYSTTIHSPTNKSTMVLPAANYSTSVLPGTNYSTTIHSPTNKSTMVLPATNYSTTVDSATNYSTTVLPNTNQSTIILPKTSQSTIIHPSDAETIKLQNLGDMTFQTDDYTVHNIFK